MTVSPSLNKQFTLPLNLAVMTNLIPYLLSMAAMLYGGIVTFAGWMLSGRVVAKFLVREPPAVEMLVDEEPSFPALPLVARRLGATPESGPRHA